MRAAIVWMVSAYFIFRACWSFLAPFDHSTPSTSSMGAFPSGIFWMTRPDPWDASSIAPWPFVCGNIVRLRMPYPCFLYAISIAAPWLSMPGQGGHLPLQLLAPREESTRNYSSCNDFFFSKQTTTKVQIALNNIGGFC